MLEKVLGNLWGSCVHKVFVKSYPFFIYNLQANIPKKKRTGKVNRANFLKFHIYEKNKLPFQVICFLKDWKYRGLGDYIILKFLCLDLVVACIGIILWEMIELLRNIVIPWLCGLIDKGKDR